MPSIHVVFQPDGTHLIEESTTLHLNYPGKSFVCFRSMVNGNLVWAQLREHNQNTSWQYISEDRIPEHLRASALILGL